jgi:hypothetical protein
MGSAAWKLCSGMNKDGKCRARIGNHISHKKVWGKWYGQVPDPTVYQVGPRVKNGPQKIRRWKKK